MKLSNWWELKHEVTEYDCDGDRYVHKTICTYTYTYRGYRKPERENKEWVDAHWNLLSLRNKREYERIGDKWYCVLDEGE